MELREAMETKPALGAAENGRTIQAKPEEVMRWQVA